MYVCLAKFARLFLILCHLTLSPGLTFIIGAIFFQWVSVIFLFLAGHLLLSAPQLGSWVKKLDSDRASRVSNDIRLSTSEHSASAPASVARAVRENGPADTSHAPNIAQIGSQSKIFVPLSAPARASGASSLWLWNASFGTADDALCSSSIANTMKKAKHCFLLQIESHVYFEKLK
jgi:hypothetical protein